VHYHIFIILVALALVGLVVRLVFGAKGYGRRQNGIWANYMACIFSGVLFANAIPHLVHGISGEVFPAPFGYLLGNGVWHNLSNVIWGFINIALGYNLLLAGKVFTGEKWRRTLFFAGFLAMAIFLCVIFSQGSSSPLGSVL